MSSDLLARALLVAAGCSLVAVAIARLLGVALRPMPRRVALGTLVVGAAVAATSLLVPSGPPAEATRGLDLAPEDEGTAASSGPVVVEGTVRLASHAPVPGADVVLHRYERTQEVATLSTQTAPDGGFRFEGLPSGPTVAYTISTDHAGTTFRSGLLLPGSDVHRADLVVAETTEDPAAVELTVDSSVFVGDEDGVRVLHILNVANVTDRAYIGGIRLPMLPGAAGLDPRRGLDRTRLVIDDGELVSLAPVLPGSTEIVYDYAVTMPRSGIEYRRTIAHPTRTYALLSSGDFDIQAAGFRDAGRVRIGGAGGRRYHQLERRSLGRGDVVRASIEARRGGSVLRAAILAAAVCIVLGSVAWPIVRRRPADGETP